MTQGKSIYLFYYISCDVLLKELYYVGGTYTEYIKHLSSITGLTLRIYPWLDLLFFFFIFSI